MRKSFYSCALQRYPNNMPLLRSLEPDKIHFSYQQIAPPEQLILYRVSMAVIFKRRSLLKFYPASYFMLCPLKLIALQGLILIDNMVSYCSASRRVVTS